MKQLRLLVLLPALQLQGRQGKLLPALQLLRQGKFLPALQLQGRQSKMFSG